jgi:hypothetical protein
MPMSKEVEQGLVAGIFGLMGTLIPAALAWARDRDVTSARVRRLDEATRRLGSWDQPRGVALAAQVVVTPPPPPLKTP